MCMCVLKILKLYAAHGRACTHVFRPSVSPHSCPAQVLSDGCMWPSLTRDEVRLDVFLALYSFPYRQRDLTLS